MVMLTHCVTEDVQKQHVLPGTVTQAAVAVCVRRVVEVEQVIVQQILRCSVVLRTEISVLQKLIMKIVVLYVTTVRVQQVAVLMRLEEILTKEAGLVDRHFLDVIQRVHVASITILLHHQDIIQKKVAKLQLQTMRTQVILSIQEAVQWYSLMVC